MTHNFIYISYKPCATGPTYDIGDALDPVAYSPSIDGVEQCIGGV